MENQTKVKKLGMHLNKKGDKVVLDTSYKMLGTSALLVQYGLPFAYIAQRYGLFTFDEGTYSVTGWGVVGIVILYAVFRNKIKAFVNDYNTTLGVTAQRGKWGMIWLSVAFILGVSTIFIDAFLWFFIVLGGSNLLALPLWNNYDVKVVQMKAIQETLKDKSNKSNLEMLEDMQRQRILLKQQKKLSKATQL